MTNEVQVVGAAPEALELQAVTTADLHERLDGAIGMTERAIMTVAMIWRELTRRGEDMSRHRFALARFMLPLASGRLLPALVVQMSGQPRALDRLAELPVDEQRRLLGGEPLEVYRGDGRVEAAPIAALTYSDITLAVRDGRVRSAMEQKLAFERSKAVRPARGRPGRPARVSITPDNRVRVGTLEVDAERVIAALRGAGLI